MWKRDEPAPTTPWPEPAETAPVPVRPSEIARNRPEFGPMGIGQSVIITGQLSAGEDLTIAGRVKGPIELGDHVLRIASSAQVSADISAGTVLIEGTVTGHVVASEKVEIRENGSVEADIAAPRVVMFEGAHFRGRVEMPRTTKTTNPTAEGSSPPAATKAVASRPDPILFKRRL